MDELDGPADDLTSPDPQIPPKYTLPPRPGYALARSITSLALYLIIGYFIFPSYKSLLLITAIVIIHELGHFLAMKLFGYGELGILFIPLLGAYVSGRKKDISQRQSAIILLAGPLPGILIGISLYLADRHAGGIFWGDVSVYALSLMFIFLNLLNLLPVFPLDGGQLLNRVFLDEESLVSKVFIVVSALALTWFCWSLFNNGKEYFYLVLLIFPVMMLLRLRTDAKFSAFEKKLEDDGINLDVTYEEMSDADYWKIRNHIIEEQPTFRDIHTAPPYEYSSKEDKIMKTIQGLLQRNLIQDMHVVEKVVVLLIWVAAFATPWWLDMDLGIFMRWRR